MVTNNSWDSNIPIEVDKGGSGRATIAANNILAGDGTNPVKLIGPGTAGQVLTSNGAGSAPTFQNSGANPFVDTTSWTPVIAGTTVAGAGTYTTQNGHYIRIGPLVVASFRIIWTAHTGTGDISVITLPVASNAAAQRYVGAIEISNVVLGLDRYATCCLDESSTTILLRESRDNDPTQGIPMDTAGEVSGTIVYFA